MVDGRALFGIAGGKLVARVRMPGKALPPFLAQPAILQDWASPTATPAAKPPSEGTIAAELAKAAAGPGKRLTADEIEKWDVGLMMFTKKPDGRTRAWKLDQVRHLYQAQTYGGYTHSLSVAVNLDDPAVPIVYI